ncbi:hypothetical protein CHR48_00590 [Weissella cibaria]|uniref:Uncharacterized protein n=1 Tax=Weissella cibaria TaxID=137591 RepID=A0A0D1LH80_9LACO|nr:hypothetical protein AUC63_01495 [Weissella cibaria]APU62892.1 hypothetical protein AUC65_01101 [Weissella cibaria]APU65043.1 hypothetical protein AUC62_01094 [Weissella cibaria]ASS51581.1 hypothetical protein CHR48_00590 [Weissella cibaria]KIU19426.1 hypothetical protein ab3b_02367 [Weissella cibaria]
MATLLELFATTLVLYLLTYAYVKWDWHKA